MRSTEVAAFTMRCIDAASRLPASPCQSLRSVGRSRFSGFSFNPNSVRAEHVEALPFSFALRTRTVLRQAQDERLLRSLADHRQIQPLFARAVNRDVVAGVRVAHDAGAGVVPEDAFEAAGCIVGTVGGNHHTGMLRIAQANPAAMMQRHPR